jgi:phytoene dehydrogenase-like protein
MKVLISGAGPGGLPAASWLRRSGHSPTIVERAPSLLVGGCNVINRMSGDEFGHRVGGDIVIVGEKPADVLPAQDFGKKFDAGDFKP